MNRPALLLAALALTLGTMAGATSADEVQDPEGQVCVNVRGDADCETAAVSADGNATSGGVAVAGTGNATGELAAVSGAGDARCPAPREPGDEAPLLCGVAASGTGNASCEEAIMCGAALSGTGDATCDAYFLCPAVASGTGDAECPEYCYAGASGTGEAEADILAVDGPVGSGVQDCAGYAPHPPIYIYGNQGPEGFILGRDPATGQPIYRPGSGVVAGNGTAEDPFVIEGWCLGSTDFGLPGIWIKKTNAHVVIRDNQFPGQPIDLPGGSSEAQDIGVKLWHADNVKVTENRLTNHERRGIYAWRSSGVHIANNTVTRAPNGIYAGASRGASLVNNTVQDSSLGLTISYASDTVVKGNALGSGGLEVAGDSLPHYQHTIPPSNTVDGEPVRYIRHRKDVDVTGPAGQVILVNTSEAQLDGLDLEAGGTGLELAFTENTTVTNTSFKKYAMAGLELAGSTGAHIADNFFSNNTAGIVDHGSTGTTITNNTMVGNPDGVELDEASRVSITHNTIRDSPSTDTYFTWGMRGIRIEDSTRVNMSGNTVTETAGVLIWDSSQLNVTDNNLSSNHHPGVLGVNASHLRMARNTLDDNGLAGVGLLWSPDALLTNNTIRRNAGHGVDLVESGGIRIAHSNIHDNAEAGLYIGEDGGSPDADARDNWWGAADGPSGGVDDACTDEVANGEGEEIKTGDGATVCFHPPLTSPNPDAGAS